MLHIDVQVQETNIYTNTPEMYMATVICGYESRVVFRIDCRSVDVIISYLFESLVSISFHRFYLSTS